MEFQVKSLLWSLAKSPRLASVLFYFWFTSLGDLAKKVTFLFHGDLYVCVQNTTFSLNQTQTNIFWGNCTLLQAGSFQYSAMSFLRGVLRKFTVDWLSGYWQLVWAYGTYSCLGIHLRGLSWACLYPACRQAFWISLEIKALHSRNILRN